MKEQDEIIKLLAFEGRISVICASTTNLVQGARDIHDLSPTTTAAFGRLVTMTAIMATDLKTEEGKLTIQLKGNGPIGTMLTVADKDFNVKGYVTNPLVELPLREDGKLDVGSAVGKEGFLNVIQDIGLKKPYTGIVPLISGEIAEDFSNYYVISKQKPSAVGLGVLVDKDGVKASGGYLIIPMPDATQEDIYTIERAIFNAGAISRMLENKLNLVEIAKKITGDENIKVIEENILPKYYCNCSKEKIAKGIETIGKDELYKIIEEDGQAEVKCHFCNKEYHFSKEELEKMVIDMHEY